MDARAFEELVVRHQGVVCGVAYAVLGDRARSEEVAQEAFLLAWRRLADAPVSAAWICGVARNLARNAARRRREVLMDDEPMSADADARDQMIAHEDVERARAALALLPGPMREAIVVYYHGGESMDAVATALSCSHEAAKQRVHRGRARLRESLEAVETTLRGRRPGAAFTGACVAAWLALDASDAAAASALSPAAVASAPVAVSFASAAAWLFTIGIAGGIAAATTPALDISDTVASEPSSRPERLPTTTTTTRSSTPPGPPGFAPPAGGSTEALAPASGALTPISIKWESAPLRAVVSLIANDMNVPLRVDDALEGVFVDTQLTDVPALEAIDQLLVQANAKRVEIDAIKIVQQGGRTDATTLGGDLVTLHLDDVPVFDALRAIEDKLHLPIARDVKANQLPGPTKVDGELYIMTAEGDPNPEYVPHVTLHVTNVTAGAALEQVLVQTGLGFVDAKGYSIVPR